MFIKLLSGELIELEYPTLNEIKSHLADRTNTPRRYIKLIDPHTGYELDHPIDTPRLAYLYCSRDTDHETDLNRQWVIEQRNGSDLFFRNCELFEQIRYHCVKPTKDLAEFKAAIQDNVIEIKESLEEDVLGRQSLGEFMMDYLHPVFLLDYLPLLDAVHFSSDTLFHLLSKKFLDRHGEEDEELILLLCKRLVPRFPITKNAYRMAVYHGYESIVRYFLSVHQK